MINSPTELTCSGLRPGDKGNVNRGSLKSSPDSRPNGGFFPGPHAA